MDYFKQYMASKIMPLFQLKYKENLKQKLLTYIIHSLLNSKEFFINKAIGWIIREYSKTNPNG